MHTLYRRYRPASFAEVRGQEHIVSALEGAIQQGSIPHAVLLTGTRGTGKTTIARLFAQALGVADVDVYEIDAASYTGVEHMRELTEAVYTLPLVSPYKVYIIDEAHMLSRSAWNAFLKTLEEPPTHAIFILATTEREKILDTVLSRCQVFEVRAPSEALIAELVRDVAEREKKKIAPEAADIIAIAARGSFRDALSITQQIFSTEGPYTADAVARVVGAPRLALVRAVLGSIATKDIAPGLAALREANEHMVDMRFFVRLLLERARAVMLYRGSKDDAYLAPFTEEEVALLKDYAAPNSSLNSRALLRLLDAEAQLGTTFIPALPLELALIDLCSSLPSVTPHQS